MLPDSTNDTRSPGIPAPDDELPSLCERWIFRYRKPLQAAAWRDIWTYDIPPGYVMDVPTDLCVPFADWVQYFEPYHMRREAAEREWQRQIPCAEVERFRAMLRLENWLMS